MNPINPPVPQRADILEFIRRLWFRREEAQRNRCGECGRLGPRAHWFSRSCSERWRPLPDDAPLPVERRDLTRFAPHTFEHMTPSTCLENTAEQYRRERWEDPTTPNCPYPHCGRPIPNKSYYDSICYSCWQPRQIAASTAPPAATAGKPTVPAFEAENLNEGEVDEEVRDARAREPRLTYRVVRHHWSETRVYGYDPR